MFLYFSYYPLEPGGGKFLDVFFSTVHVTKHDVFSIIFDPMIPFFFLPSIFLVYCIGAGFD